nr:hypothetical protein [Pseudomonas sp.]
MELLSGLNGWLVAALGGIVAIAVAYLGGKSRGASREKVEAELRQRKRDAEQAEIIRRSLEERIKADEAVSKLPDGGAAQRLRDEFSRD